MSFDLKQRLKEKSVSPKIVFLILGVEFVLMILVPILDVFFKTSFYTFGRFMHFFCLIYVTGLTWIGLREGKLALGWQIVFFVIVPLIEFVLLNVMGYSNLLGWLFLIVYCCIICLMFDIDINGNEVSGRNSGKLFGKLMGKILKDL